MAGNVNDRVTSTPSQILQGAGQLKIDGVDVGGFEGGVQLNWAQTEVFVDSEWSLGSVDAEITNVDFQITTSLEESTLENIAIAWGLPSSSVLSGTSSKTLDLNPASKMQTVGLVFEGMSGTNRDKIRTFTVDKAVKIGSSQTVLNRGIKTVVPVTFKCLLNDSGSFGAISDSTITA